MMNRSTTQIRLLVAVLVSILSFSFAKAEASDSNLPDSKGWYLGVDGGLPFGLSTFSSFGHDKTHLGWAAGIYGGYRFNPIFSAELSARYGEVNLSAQDCCVERNYWLGSDGMLYKASVLGMDSWEYAQLKSHVRMGWYGARVHLNLLGLLRNTAHSRWTVAVSPHLYAVTTCADIQTLADHAEVMKGFTRWHLGYGASLQAGYQLTSNLNLGIYSGLTRLSGERMDGMPEHLHKNNFVWESGIRLGISFSKKKNKIVETPSVPQTEVLHQDTILSGNVNQKEKETVDKAETKVVEQDIKEPVKVTFPVIYFSFNRITIRPSEVSKLKSILHILKENPEMKVTVTGWCDTRGSVAVNRRISRQRAQALKTWLVKRGIAASRISVVGKGSDASRTAPKARRVETTNHHQ
ncbi:OmpA family protein [Prevotella copri]|uniref:OmpA family protein n=1 Tax=Segatella copri TaxID=165179 RepID=A0AAW5IL42_9BACT|nr:OmpA family protein [Segatella copri]MCP9533888.1 OmpA family protein [Segatella copri]MCP9536781.1 OmpA family protein [Segatella copri]MCP9539969.1 OmpA family protein [Segatella copri]MCP9558073.1 OmpA family protein [Segatella copri]MCP9560883.1 OmpA family protein [Segatella copri]